MNIPNTQCTYIPSWPAHELHSEWQHVYIGNINSCNFNKHERVYNDHITLWSMWQLTYNVLLYNTAHFILRRLSSVLATWMRRCNSSASGTTSPSLKSWRDLLQTASKPFSLIWDRPNSVVEWVGTCVYPAANLNTQKSILVLNLYYVYAQLVYKLTALSKYICCTYLFQL